MRSLFIAVLVAGCGFSGTAPPGGNGGGEIDAFVPPGSDAGIDAPMTPGIDAAIDAAIDAPPPMWTIVDTLTVSCLDQMTTSTYVLLAGVTYRLRATGTCVSNNTNGSRGDAEYTYNTTVINDGSGGVDTGIAINDTTEGSTKNPRWGPYTTTHEYEVMWIGTGATITAKVHADNYSNNSGSLTLHVLAYQ